MQKHDQVLLDTHALVWWQAASPLLSAAATKTIESAQRLAVCPISFWEIAMLERKGRLTLDRPVRDWCVAVGRDDRIDIVAITPAIAANAGTNTDLHGDPADRLICATAIERRLPLVTKDGSITEWATTSGGIDIVW